MDATEKSDQRGEEEAEGEEESPKAEEDSNEGAGNFRILIPAGVLNSNDLRMAMIPGYLEYAKDYEANKAKAEMQRVTNKLRKDLDRRALYGLNSEV